MDDITVEDIIEQLTSVLEWLEEAGPDYCVPVDMTYTLLEEIKSLADS